MKEEIELTEEQIAEIENITNERSALLAQEEQHIRAHGRILGSIRAAELKWWKSVLGKERITARDEAMKYDPIRRKIVPVDE